MPSFDTGRVIEIVEERAGLQRLRVAFDRDGDADGHEGGGTDDGIGERAYCLTELVGRVRIGDRVVCNTTAVRLGLGTGGHHIVHWNLSRGNLDVPGPDHVMKLRYTSLQFDAGTSELVHPHIPADLGGRPVVAFSVHSQLGIMATMLARERPDLSVAYLMTDGASLPLALSDLVERLCSGGAIRSTVTAGHAFGGDLEAVTVASGLALAAHVGGADVILAGMGPGVVGTGTTLGTTGIEAASILDTTVALGGRAVLCARASSGDARPRHAGVSHHTDTVLALAAHPPLMAPFPEQLRDRPDIAEVGVEVPTLAEIVVALDAADLAVTTMGRGPTEDELFFRAAAAAARVAVRIHDDAH